MSKSLPLVIVSLFLSIGIVSCVSEPDTSKIYPVVDGWINSDGIPTVIFTASLNPEEKDQKISKKIIQWGKVTISDGTDTVILTGGPDKNFFPPYKYYSYKMEGKPGKTYTLTAEYEDLYATAECFMPWPTPIDSLLIRPIEGNDTLRSGTLYFTAPSDTPAYYYLTIRDMTESGRSRPLPAMLGTVKATQPGEKMEVAVYNPKNQLDTAAFIPQLRVGHQLQVNLCRVTEDVYDFWNSYDNSTIVGSSVFISAGFGDKGGNIKGGYGIWSAQGVSSKLVEVK